MKVTNVHKNIIKTVASDETLDNLNIKERDKKLFQSYVFDGLSYVEVGELHGIGGVRSRQIVERILRDIRFHLKSTPSHKEYKQKEKETAQLNDKVDELNNLLGQKNDKHRPIEELDISVRAYNSLKSTGATFIKDIEDMGASEVLRCRNVGKKTFMEIEEAVKPYGIEL